MAETVKFECEHGDCIYRSHIASGQTPICNYLLIEKHSRGCKIGECSKYVSSHDKKKVVKTNSLYQLEWQITDKDNDGV